MKNICLAILTVLATASCTKYDISGSSDLYNVDGRMLFLKAITTEKLESIDSCDVVHGKFKFSGPLDSVRVVMLCNDEHPILPVVLEDGSIDIVINGQRSEVKGTPLNDTLTTFLQRYGQILMRLEDLSHQHSQAIMNGEDMDAVETRLYAEGQQLRGMEDRLISTFIAENFDNCLGPYVFQFATEAYPYPVLEPWIEALMMKATPAFKQNQYVVEFMRIAQYNQNQMTGMTDESAQIPQQAEPATPPTPNELAQPGE